MTDSSVIPTSVAVIGAGAAGLGAAWLLTRGGYAVHLFESRETPGGHAHTIDIPLPGNAAGVTIPVDAGFMVYNSRTYPDLVSLFQMLNIEEENSSMSFSTSIQLPNRKKYFEWGSDSPATLFADRANLYKPSMYTMLYDMYRFNNAVYEFLNALEKDPQFKDRDVTLGEFLENNSYSTIFICCYLIPMVSAVWSASVTVAMAFPARTLFQFFVNHGLAQVFARPQWRTPSGRSRDYVNKIVNDIRKHSGIVLLGNRVTKVVRDVEGVTVWSETCDPKRFDQVVFATHAPTTLDLLGDDATEDERRILGAFLYSKNKAYIHHDATLMPTNKAVWSSWNFIGRTKIKRRNAVARMDLEGERGESETRREDGEQSRQGFVGPRGVERELAENGESIDGDDEPVCVTYWLNRLQNYHKHPFPVPDLFITLNPVTSIDPQKILQELIFDHPQFTDDTVKAQPLLQEVIQGKNRSWFCGAYARFGFHEDAMVMGLDVAERLSSYKNLRPWRSKHCLVINDNSRPYEMPYSPLRTPLIIYLGVLLVLNTVMARIRQGLSKIAERMADDDPIVCVAVGDGRLSRFGPNRSRARTRGSTPVPEAVESNQSARLTVRSPKLLSRIADALRQGHLLAPTAAAAFAASEYDCPTPDDLTTILKSLFIADRLDLDPSKSRRGRAKFAESLLFSIVGGFKKVTMLSTYTQLPELTTCISNVVYPSWWLELDRETITVDDKGVEIPRFSQVSPQDLRESKRILEVLGDLSEATIAILQSNEDCRATVVLQNLERAMFVGRKAELLFVRHQIETVLLEDFVKERINNAGGPAKSNTEIADACFDIILSPAIANNFIASGFKTLKDAFLFLRDLATPEAIIELGVTVHGCRPGVGAKRRHLHIDQYFSGDERYKICHTRELLEKSEECGYELQRISFMDHDEAAMDVDEVIQRVYNSLAKEKLKPEETRAALAQMCLWEAALLVKYIRRMAVSFKLSDRRLGI